MLPPQAITARDKAEAFNWFLNLPQTVRESIKTMDQAVALYLQTKRLGNNVNFDKLTAGPMSHSHSISNGQDTPSTQSTKDFKQNLKNLQVEMEKFEFVSPGTQPPQQEQFQPANSHPTPVQPPIHHQPRPTPVQQTHVEPPAAPKLDTKSQAIIDNIREALNLSSDAEVLRIALSIAHRKILELLK